MSVQKLVNRKHVYCSIRQGDCWSSMNEDLNFCFEKDGKGNIIPTCFIFKKFLKPDKEVE